MLIGVILILSLHAIAAVGSLLGAARNGLGFKQCLQWGGIGFLTGILGLVTHAGTDWQSIYFARASQDAVLNLGLEIIAIFGLPLLLNLK